jgi:hypothetical protein
MSGSFGTLCHLDQFCWAVIVSSRLYRLSRYAFSTSFLGEGSVEMRSRSVQPLVRSSWYLALFGVVFT